MTPSSIGAAQGAQTSYTGSGAASSLHQLNKALRKGDLAGAKEAYADILKNPPAGATWDPDSTFAQLGKALVKGDVQAARSIAADAVKARIRGSTAPEPEPSDDPLSPDAQRYGNAPGSLSVRA